MIKYFENLAKALLGMQYGDLSVQEKRVIDSIANKAPLPENINEIFERDLTFGERLADKVSAFGGSWTFIFIFLGIMTLWIAGNSYWLLQAQTFDPYPYILLNLILSTLAALQAPIIMMSQNRQAEKDRLKVEANYAVSLKSDLEIMRLHEKIDTLQHMLHEIQKTPLNVEGSRSENPDN